MSNHYSDGELLGLLDGETSRLEKARSWFHLRRCWACRARMAELESTAHRFALALQRDDFPGGDRVARAKQDFLRRASAYSAPPRARENAFQSPAIRRVAWLSPALAGLVLAATGTVGLLFTRGDHARPATKAPSPVATRQPVSTSAAFPAAPPVLPPAPAPAKAPSSAAPPKLATSIQLEAAELEARYALHRANLDLAPIEFVQSPGRLTIRGYSAEQQAALRYLTQRGYVRLAFESPDLPDGPVTAVQAPPATRRAPIEDHLSAWFAQRPFPSAQDRNRAYAAYLNEVVSLATKAKRAAMGLRRLADRYRAAPLHQFPAEHRWLLEAMIRDYLSSLDMITERERILLETVFPSGPAQVRAPSPGLSPWSSVCLELFTDVSASHSAIVEIFTSRDASDRNVPEAVARIQSQLHEWPGRRAEAEIAISRQFSSRSGRP